MPANQVTKETLPDGSVRISCAGCSFVYSRLRPGALLVTITGNDTGQFGTATLDEIRMEMLRQRPIELFVDASDAVGASVNVSKEWTQFFSLNREHLKRVSILAGSKVVHLTVSIAQHLSQTGNLIQIYSDADLFKARVAAG